MFQFISGKLTGNFYQIFTINRSYTGKVINYDDENVIMENPLISEGEIEDEIPGDISINQRMIEAVIEAEKE